MGKAVTPGQQVLPYPLKVLVKELTDRYNASRIGNLINRVIGTFESKHLVRMLIEEIEPVAECGVDFALRPLSWASEADRRSLAVGPVDVRDKASVLIPQIGWFPFASYSGSPCDGADLRITLAKFAANCNPSPQNRRRMAWIKRDSAGIGKTSREAVADYSKRNMLIQNVLAKNNNYLRA